jgi:hypothetical protein
MLLRSSQTRLLKNLRPRTLVAAGSRVRFHSRPYSRQNRGEGLLSEISTNDRKGADRWLAALGYTSQKTDLRLAKVGTEWPNPIARVFAMTLRFRNDAFVNVVEGSLLPPVRLLENRPIDPVAPALSPVQTNSMPSHLKAPNFSSSASRLPLMSAA